MDVRTTYCGPASASSSFSSTKDWGEPNYAAQQRCCLSTRAMLFNNLFFDGQLPLENKVQFSWGTKMQRNGGQTKFYPRTNFCEVLLNRKLLNSDQKINDTLLHEMCHLAVIFIECDRYGGHGPLWRKWVELVNEKARPLGLNIQITEKHFYPVIYPFTYICEATHRNEQTCNIIYGSWQSIKPQFLARYRCKNCYSNLVQAVMKTELPPSLRMTHIKKAGRVMLDERLGMDVKSLYNPLCSRLESPHSATDWTPLIELIKTNASWMDFDLFKTTLTLVSKTKVSTLTWFIIPLDNTILHKFSICSLDYLDHKRIARSDYAPGRFVMLLSVHQGWAKVLSTYGIVVEERTQQLVAIFVDNYHDDTSQFLRP